MNKHIRKKTSFFAVLFLVCLFVYFCRSHYTLFGFKKKTEEKKYWVTIPLHGKLALHNHKNTKDTVGVLEVESLLSELSEKKQCAGIILDLKLKFGFQLADAEAIGNAIAKFRQNSSGKKVIACTHLGTKLHDQLIASYADLWFHDDIKKKMFLLNEELKLVEKVFSKFERLKKNLEEMGIHIKSTKVGKHKGSFWQELILRKAQQQWCYRKILANRAGRLRAPKEKRLISMFPKEAVEKGIIDRCIDVANALPPSKIQKSLVLPNHNDANKAKTAEEKILIIDIGQKKIFSEDQVAKFLLMDLTPFKIVIIMLDTNGGSVYLTDKFLKKINHCKKEGTKVVGIARNSCFSAGFHVACCCDELYAYGGSGVGSVGVKLRDSPYLDPSPLMQKYNIKATDRLVDVVKKIKKQEGISGKISVRSFLKSLGANKHFFSLCLCAEKFTMFDFERDLDDVLESVKSYRVSDFLEDFLKDFFDFGHVYVGYNVYFKQIESAIYRYNLLKDYEPFSSDVRMKTGLTEEEFSQKYGEGRLYLAHNDFVDFFVEGTVTDTLEKIAKEADIENPFFDR